MWGESAITCAKILRREIRIDLTDTEKMESEGESFGHMHGDKFKSFEEWKFVRSFITSLSKSLSFERRPDHARDARTPNKLVFFL